MNNTTLFFQSRPASERRPLHHSELSVIHGSTGSSSPSDKPLFACLKICRYNGTHLFVPNLLDSLKENLLVNWDSSLFLVHVFGLTIGVENQNSTGRIAVTLRIATKLLFLQAIGNVFQASVDLDGVPWQGSKDGNIAKGLVQFEIFVEIQREWKVLRMELFQAQIVNTSLLDDSKQFKAIQGLVITCREVEQLLPMPSAKESPRPTDSKHDAARRPRIPLHCLGYRDGLHCLHTNSKVNRNQGYRRKVYVHHGRR